MQAKESRSDLEKEYRQVKRQLAKYQNIEEKIVEKDKLLKTKDESLNAAI
jgi:hypothetical protein